MTETTMQHLSDDQLVLLYYREPLDESRLNGHLSGCALCLARFETLTRVLRVVADDDVPEPKGDFESRMITSVLERAAREAQPERGRVIAFRPRVSKVVRYLAGAAALAACLILTFTVGRDFGQKEERTLSAAQRQERVLLTGLGEHLSRSRVTLVELKNRDASAADLKALQEAADNLVAASRLFRAAAERAGEGQIAGVMEETERLLVRFAAAPDRDAKSELDGLRSRVDSKDLLFRLQVMEAHIEKREKEIAPTPGKSAL
jgi:hypothetical protein